jgi:hypothetical protein
MLLSFNTLLIIILVYFLILIISRKFNENNQNNKKEAKRDNEEGEKGEREGFQNNIRSPPEPEDPKDKRYKPVLKQNVTDLCNRPSKDYCLPYKINEVPDKKNNDSNFDLENNNNEGFNNLIGHNFLNAKYHAQINKVGNFKGNYKVDIRPEPINPQVGVQPTTQSIINIDWPNNKKIALYSQNYSDIWQRLI